MKVKRIIACIALMAAVLFSALADEAEIKAWLEAYNRSADAAKAQRLAFDDDYFEDEDGIHVFVLSDDEYLALYVGASGNVDALMIETGSLQEGLMKVLACGLCAADETISYEAALASVQKTVGMLAGGAEGRYAYNEEHEWIFMLGEVGIGSNQSWLYSVVRASAYDEIVGEDELPEAAPEQAPDESESAPEDGKQEKDKNGSILHKI